MRPFAKHSLLCTLLLVLLGGSRAFGQTVRKIPWPRSESTPANANPSAEAPSVPAEAPSVPNDTMPTSTPNYSFPIQWYGNYGGLGGRTHLPPIDGIDAKFKDHDDDYDNHGRFDGLSDARLTERLFLESIHGNYRAESRWRGIGAAAFYSLAPGVVRVQVGSTKVPVAVAPGIVTLGVVKSVQASTYVKSVANDEVFRPLGKWQSSTWKKIKKWRL